MARRIARFFSPDGAKDPDTQASPAKSRTRRKTETAADDQARRAPPSREQIAARAYEIFLARGAEHGYAEEDWLQAERELRQTDPSFPLPASGGHNR